MFSRRREFVLALTTLPLLALAACGGSSPATEVGTEPVPGIAQPLIDAAQLEGAVTVYAGGHTQPDIELLQSMFQERYGITVTFNRTDSGSVAKAVTAELAGGRVNADVVSLADASTMQKWNADGLLADSGLGTLGGVVEGFDDPATPQVPISLMPMGVMYNSARTQSDQVPTSWAELAATDHGSIVTSNPSASGTALSCYLMLARNNGATFLAGLAARKPVVSDSSQALPQLVLTGEADLGMPALESLVTSAAAQGEPLSIAYMSDGVPTLAAESAVMAGAPHPNAARLLLQYQLSDEFQRAQAATGSRSVLADVPPPPNTPATTDLTMLTATAASVAAAKDATRADFDKAMGR